MARIDLTMSNGWVPEEYGSQALTAAYNASAVEQKARREAMASETKAVPRILGDDPQVVAKGAAYPEAAPTLDDVVLVARKFGQIFRIAEEDLNDSLVNVLDAFKVEFAGRYARKFDNACLGVTAAGDGTDAHPFDSVYKTVKAAVAGNVITTAAATDPTFAQLSGVLSDYEDGDYYDDANTVVIAHPSFKGILRQMTNAAGFLVATTGLDGTPTQLFGYDIVWSKGARTSATATSSPAGNPLLIVGNSRHLILGDRAAMESRVSVDAAFSTDEPLLKVRARRGFAVGRPEAFSIVERSA